MISKIDEYLEALKKIDIEENNESYDIYKEISTLIIEIRLSLNLSQNELAKKAGLTQANISNIENEISKPTIDSLVKIANAFGKRLFIDFIDR